VLHPERPRWQACQLMEAPAKVTLVTEPGREGDVRQAAVCLQQQFLSPGDSTSDHEFVWWHPNGAMKRPCKVGNPACSASALVWRDSQRCVSIYSWM
jgi:hypothetical protein